ncbi:hypothetical protein LZ32DRAFT_48631 [Colletotrichum eremochloae]|nr:hypothetical protein LZ32DRAFT_48631 [Colletotrichum eremochloae]
MPDHQSKPHQKLGGCRCPHLFHRMCDVNGVYCEGVSTTTERTPRPPKEETEPKANEGALPPGVAPSSKIDIRRLPGYFIS